MQQLTSHLFLLESLDLEQMSLVLSENLIDHDSHSFSEHLWMLLQLSQDILVETLHLPVDVMNTWFNNFWKVIDAVLGLTPCVLEIGRSCPAASCLTLERLKTFEVILGPPHCLSILLTKTILIGLTHTSKGHYTSAIVKCIFLPILSGKLILVISHGLEIIVCFYCSTRFDIWVPFARVCSCWVCCVLFQKS